MSFWFVFLAVLGVQIQIPVYTIEALIVKICKTFDSLIYMCAHTLILKG